MAVTARSMGLFATVFALAALALAIFARPDFMIAPGRLRPGHAPLARDCLRCHRLFDGVPADKCLSCHKIGSDGQIAATTPARRGAPRPAFHHKLIEKSCVACHSDHEGTAPYRAKPVFSHGLLEPAARRQCASCHRQPG